MRTGTRYDPALGCEDTLDAWCASHCPVPPVGDGPLQARQPSTHGAPVFACYSTAMLSQLDLVTSNLTARPPNLCGAKSSSYVHSLKQTRESAALVAALMDCNVKQRGHALTSGKGTKRRAQVAALNLPLVRGPRPGDTAGSPYEPATDPTAVASLSSAEAAEGAAWLKATDDGGVTTHSKRLPGHARVSRVDAAALRTEGAAQCLRHGKGEWAAIDGATTAEPYLLAPDVLPRANLSKWWWGVCDDDLRHGSTRPPRAAVMQEWQPRGEGCDALRKGRPRLPSLRPLAAAFCQRYAGRSVLFVGDSVQGQLFVSFAMALGVFGTERQMVGVTRDRLRCAKDRHYLSSLENVHEFYLNMRLCASGAAGVRATFVRNELLWLDEMPAEKVPRNFLMCGWKKDEWLNADLMVLNRGMHFSDDGVFTKELAATFQALGDARRSSGMPLAGSVVYRGTHAPIPSCHILDDPLPAPFPYTASADDPLVRGYHWAEFARQNRLASDLAGANNLTYLDVHTATSYRPGGHMPTRKSASGDCAHYCIPGPIDEWVRLLLAFWT